MQGLLEIAFGLPEVGAGVRNNVPVVRRVVPPVAGIDAKLESAQVRPLTRCGEDDEHEREEKKEEPFHRSTSS